MPEECHIAYNIHLLDPARVSHNLFFSPFFALFTVLVLYNNILPIFFSLFQYFFPCPVDFQYSLQVSQTVVYRPRSHRSHRRLRKKKKETHHYRRLSLPVFLSHQYLLCNPLKQYRVNYRF